MPEFVIPLAPTSPLPFPLPSPRRSRGRGPCRLTSRLRPRNPELAPEQKPSALPAPDPQVAAAFTTRSRNRHQSPPSPIEIIADPAAINTTQLFITMSTTVLADPGTDSQKPLADSQNSSMTSLSPNNPIHKPPPHAQSPKQLPISDFSNAINRSRLCQCFLKTVTTESL
jgi:hypothetical protein